MAKQIQFADAFQPAFGMEWIPPFTEAQMASLDDERLRKYVHARRTLEAMALENPVANGWTLPSWELVKKNWKKYNVHILLGGNQSAKSTLGSRLALSMCAAIPEAEIYSFHISEKRSIDDAQRFIYEALPDSLRNMLTKKGVAHNLQYTQKNGFTDGILILPPHPGFRRGGSIKFYNYAQYQQNSQIVEGIKPHMVWADEKIPFDLFETLRMGRLGTHHGRFLLTYTVVDGWNDTIEKILAKRKTLLTRFCDHPKIMTNLPIMEESLSVGSCAIYYAWTQDNPFTDVREFYKQYGNENKEVILARAFGVPTKSIASAFPLFSKEYASAGGNVVKHEDLPWLKPRLNAKGVEIPYKTTRYMAIDLGGSKNWCMLWVAIDAAGTWWVYREWPDSSYGDWALPGDKEGPAQKSLGLDIKGYVELIRNYEDGEEIFERYIDPRMGAAEKQSKDRGAVTIISDLDECGMPVIPAPAAPSEADKGEIEDGIQLISNLLYWDQKKPQSALNTPKLYVSDRCQNFIYCMQEYTGRLGAKEHTKDMIDVIRYLRKGNCEYVEKVVKDYNRTGVY